MAAKVGKSKSYCDDRIRLAQNLSPEVSHLVGNGNGTAPDLDLAVMRELSCKIPPSLQSPLTDWLKKDAANGTGSQALVKLVGKLGRFLDPTRYTPENASEPPRMRNRRRLLLHLLQHTPPAQLIAAIYQADWVTMGVEAFLGNTWNFYPLVNSIHSSQHSWDTDQTAWQNIAPGQGWGCATCLLREMHHVISQRDSLFDNEAACLRLKATRHDPTAELPHTCDHFIAEGDPQPVITLPRNIWNWLEANDWQQYLRGKDSQGDYYTDNLVDFVSVYAAAVRTKAEARQQAQTDLQTRHLEPMHRYWQAQQDDRLNLTHFYAAVCRKCRHFTGADDIPCRFAREPLQNPLSNNPRAPEYGLWLPEKSAANPRPVPRCEMFAYAGEYLALPRPLLAGAHIPDRAQVASWFADLLSREGWHLKEIHLYRALAVLGVRHVDDLLALWQTIGDDDVMLSLLHMVSEQIKQLQTYQGQQKSIVIISPTGERETFTPQNFIKEQP